ncbi:hypothetical protein TrispH2_006209 [Trichoplax sp. H2]|uniref:Uncharacterized protein n=1 Tax=Trichoplax adhaerens TaxID=10228 RepID=B3S3C4_TRIAD|nr:predicted protein [Trichoplax adhaerens]EDV22767.1 predicted protein [Trichoplax adhaerens]RDD41679.1 hypothetical protein TrispH2_006209 [Trichoplax sp. H2]|eukprot:XP_002114633.1 predicted protein [Trichoplax adhaerens]
MGPMLYGAMYPFSYSILREICSYPGSYVAVWSDTTAKSFIHVYYQHDQGYYNRHLSEKLTHLCKKAFEGDIGVSRGEFQDRCYIRRKTGRQCIYYRYCKPSKIIPKVKHIYQNISQTSIIDEDILDAILINAKHQENSGDKN